MRWGGAAGDEVEAHRIDADSHAPLDLTDQVGAEAREEIPAQVFGHIDEAAVGRGDVGVLGEIRIEPGRAAVARVEALAEPGVEEHFERVVDGGEAEAGVLGVDGLVKVLCGRVGAALAERGVDHFALARGADAVSLEQVPYLVEGYVHRTGSDWEDYMEMGDWAEEAAN